MDASLLILYVVASFLALKSLVSLMAGHKRKYLLEKIAQERIGQGRPPVTAAAESESTDIPKESAA